MSQERVMSNEKRREDAEALRQKVSTFLPETPYLDHSTLQSLKNPLIIDIRNPDESNLGTIPNSLSPKDALPFLDSSRPIVCFCTIGLRSGAHARTLQAPGRTVYNYSVLEHLWAGQALVRPDGTKWDNTVHVYSAHYASVFPEQYQVGVFSGLSALTKALPAIPSLTGAVAAWARRRMTEKGPTADS